MKLARTLSKTLGRWPQLAALLASALLISTAAHASRIEIPPLASEAEVQEAFAAFEAWTEHYQQGEYEAQYELIHERIRKYKTRKSWVSRMKRSVLNNGPLEKIEILAVGPIEAENIPCTEMGHCYRKDMQTVMIVVNSRYAKVGAREKEYIVMARSEDGWRYGGGTFLNRPYGETMAILDRKDERAARYQRNTSK